MVVGVSPFAVGVVGGKGGVVMMMVRWMDGLGAHPAAQIERGPRARALFVAHEVGSYPSSPASDWNGSLRSLTTPSLVHRLVKWCEEAWGWRAIIARRLGKPSSDTTSQSAHCGGLEEGGGRALRIHTR